MKFEVGLKLSGSLIIVTLILIAYCHAAAAVEKQFSCISLDSPELIISFFAIATEPATFGKVIEIIIMAV